MASTSYILTARSSGTPTAGLSPTWNVLRKVSDGTSVSSPATAAPITELAGGGYKVTYDPEGASGELYGVVDFGSGISDPNERYADMYLSKDSSRIQTALPNVAAGAAGGLPTGDASGRVLLQPTQAGVTIPTVTAITNAVPLPTTAPSGYGGGLTSGQDTTLTGIATKTANLPSDPASNTQVNTRLATSAYVAPDNADIVTSLADLVTLLGRTDPSAVLTSIAAQLTQAMGLLGLNQGVRNFVYASNVLQSYDVCLYDSAPHAVTNDGVTGLLHKHTVTLGYTSGNQTAQTTAQVS